MHDGQPLAAELLQVLERETRDALRRAARDALGRLGRVGIDHALDAHVEIFGVLAEDDEIDIVVARFDARVILDRTHGGVETELLAQADRDARINAVADVDRIRVSERRLRRPFERQLVFADRFEHRFGQWPAGFLARAHARLGNFPLDGGPGGSDDFARGTRDFRADPVARNQSNTMHHLPFKSSGPRLKSQGLRVPPS